MSRKSISLYIHIPFCKSKCYYCDFNSFVCRDEDVPAYFNLLRRELLLYKELLKGYTISTVFIGGGTPSLVDANNIYQIVFFLREIFEVDKDAEITIESNPGTLTLEKLEIYVACGINRLSIGLQAIQEDLLRKMGRIHSLEEFSHSYSLALKAGFKNINVDVIFGIPGQRLDDWKNTIEYMLKCEPTHLSCYSLKIEENSVFGEKHKNGKLIPVDDDLDRQMYWYAINKLKEKGYRHYEISNFAMQNYSCRHNLVYWKCEEYIGLGTGAHSFFNNKRYSNVINIRNYSDSIGKGIIPKENQILIAEQDRISEFIILGLRLIDGVAMEEFERKFDKCILDIYEKEITSLIKKNLLQISDKTIKLTSTGLDLANQVFVEFI
ncbi:UNVERIFIED_CONTAM: oxygen-independent coproporphyrinogen-3 oxidase [Acetivibrio alkalicellulosi]